MNTSIKTDSKRSCELSKTSEFTSSCESLSAQKVMVFPAKQKLKTFKKMVPKPMEVDKRTQLEKLIDEARRMELNMLSLNSESDSESFENFSFL